MPNCPSYNLKSDDNRDVDVRVTIAPYTAKNDILSLKVPITIAADNSLEHFFIVFQLLISSKDKIKTNVLSAAILLGSLRFNFQKVGHCDS